MKSLESDLELANHQISILTEIVTLDPKEQASRLKEVEKLPLNPDNLMRIKTLRSNLESLPSTPSRQAVTQYTRFIDSEFTNFSLSPEILSEKLYDSVKMIRELMNSNKKLKETISDLTQHKKIVETENVQLHNDNQELVERIEVLENLIQSTQDKSESTEIVKVQKEKKKKLAKKIENFEGEKKKNSELNASTGEWNWRSKRTILRNLRQGHDGKAPIVSADRHKKHRFSMDNPPQVKAYRPLSQELAMDSTKQEAIATLSKILMSGMPY